MSEIKCQFCSLLGHKATECPSITLLGPNSQIPNWAPPSYYPSSPSPWYYPPPPPPPAPSPWYYPPQQPSPWYYPPQPPSPWYYPPPTPSPWYHPPPPQSTLNSTTDLPPTSLAPPSRPQSTPRAPPQSTAPPTQSTAPSRPTQSTAPSRSTQSTAPSRPTQSTAPSRPRQSKEKGKILLPNHTDGFFALHVSNLETMVTEDDLTDLFSTISPEHTVYIPKDRDSGKSLCYAYVNFTSSHKAAEALVCLDNHKLYEKPIRVTWSKRNPYFRNTGIGNLFVKNISLTTTDDQFQALFRGYGTIISCKIAKDEKGKNRMFGYVHFEKEESALNAITGLNGFEFNGKKLYVGKFLQRSERNEHEPGNVYVKFIDTSITESVLVERFKAFGVVESASIVIGANGKSAGYGFVRFVAHEDALKAIKELDGVKFDDNKWDVKPGYVKRSGSKEKEADYANVSNLLVMNIAGSTDDNEIKQIFGAFGDIQLARLLCSKDGSVCGVVSFLKAEDAEKAMRELNGYNHKGQCLNVTPVRRVEEHAKYLQDKGYVLPN